MRALSIPADAARERSVAILACKDHIIVCPDVLNSAAVLADRGWRVDVLVLDSPLYPQPSPAVAGVRIVPRRTLYSVLRGARPRSSGAPSGAADRPDGGAAAPPAPPWARGAAALLRSLQKAEFAVGSAARLVLGGYRLAIACDTPSLLAARTARAVRGTPYVYHSRELVLSADARSPGRRLAKRAERLCHRAASLTVIQDRTRAALLGADNGVVPASFLIVPNAPRGEFAGAPSDDLARRLGVPAGRPVVLHAGGVTPENMVLEAISSIAGWPPEPVLVVHGPAENSYLPLLRAAAARFPGRVFFSQLLVRPDEVDALFAGAAVGLAFYRPADLNLLHVGHAAGKIFNFMKVGVPTICNDLPGMRELLEETGCGAVVADPSRTGDALGRLLAQREARRADCLRAFPRFEFERNYLEVVRRAEALR